MKQCEKCLAEGYKCPYCIYNQMNSYEKEFFQGSTLACPRGFSKCVSDSTYIKQNYPKWYEWLYEKGTRNGFPIIDKKKDE